MHGKGMRHLLAPEEVGALERLARSHVLLAFDFDGTLAPIVADRDAAAMRARTRELFEEVCGLYPCAVVSGRMREDVEPRLGGARVKYVVGNHGIDPAAGGEAFRREAAAMRPVLEERLRGRPGVEIEDNGYSLAVHYRAAPDVKEAKAAIEAAIAGLGGPLRVVPGKRVVNVIPGRAPNKGDALGRLWEREGAEAALYIGDDVTDEDVFALERSGLVTVRVGASQKSKAQYFVRDQREVDDLLGALIGLRSAKAAAR